MNFLDLEKEMEELLNDLIKNAKKEEYYLINKEFIWDIKLLVVKQTQKFLQKFETDYKNLIEKMDFSKQKMKSSAYLLPY